MQQINQIAKRHGGGLWISHLPIRAGILKETFQRISEDDIHVSGPGRKCTGGDAVTRMHASFIFSRKTQQIPKI